jgi:hypothetical protein
MAEQDWPEQHSSPSDPLYAAPLYARYELRPLSVGEILDRIFSLYRAHFWLFVGLSALSAGVSAAAAILRLVYQHFSGVTVASPSFVFINAGIGIVQGVFYLLAYGFTLAATTSAVHTLYLGQPSSLQIALATARRLWLRCVGISFWQTWSAIWIFILLLFPVAFLAAMRQTALAILLGLGLFVSLIYGVIAYLRNSLAVPSAVIEDLSVRDAMRRSKDLATNSIGRIFLMMLLFYVLMTVAGVVQLPLAFLIVRNRGTEQFMMQGLVLAINFFTTSLVGPIAAIGLCLFYFDERVRKEGFDIEMLLHGASVPPPPMQLMDAPLMPVPAMPIDVMPADVADATHPTPEQM